MSIDSPVGAVTPAGGVPSGTGGERRSVPVTGTEVMGDGGSAVSTARTRFRRAVPLLIGMLVLALVVVLNLLPGEEEDDSPLSPGNPGPDGARAVARVLEAEGVDVVRVHSFDDALEELDGGRGTLFLNDARQYLSGDQVAELTGTAARSVLAAPGERQLRSLDEDFEVVGPVPTDIGGDAPALAAECADTDASAAVSVSATGTLYSGGVQCFTASVEGAGNTEDTEDTEDAEGGLYVTSPDGSISILGAPSILSNDSVTDAGNAALALRVLGSSPALVWYEPTGADITSSGQGVDPTTLLPAWVNPLLVWLLVCGVLGMFWRGRRLGPLAEEPLPVVVRAAETAEGRARLYQDSRSVAHSAANLRSAGLARIARRLRVDRSASPVDVLDAAARHTGRSRADLEQQFLHRTPATNRELVLWAQDILDLEKEITSS